MARDERSIRVFVSSTSEDLKDYRAVARNVIMDLGWVPTMMEHFGSSPDATVDACCRAVERCDLVLLIVAWRRGWVPTVEQGGNGRDSITALEMTCAREKKIPVLPLFAADTWPGSQWEDDEVARKYVKEFRSNLNQPAVFFDCEKITAGGEQLPAFRAKVKESLLKQKERILEVRGGGAGGGEGLDYFESAREGLLEGVDVPFLGARLYEDGPLGPVALAKALLGSEARDEVPFLATAAEYRWQYLGSRDRFLAQFRRILEEQTLQVGPLPVHDLLVKSAGHRLLVSSSWDMVFESRLEEAGHDFVVVAHVMSSYDRKHDGKVAVFRKGGGVDLLPADELTLGKEETYVYKPVGSPFLNDRFDEDDEIDTVVVTETDHATLVHRLAQQSTSIPNSIGMRFARKPLLFLGYGLDVWQYRLMMFVYHLAWQFKRRKEPIIAVRVPDSPIEEVAWKRLRADLVRMDPNAFARRVLEAG
ncbi:MAG: DUF4062 domain-containing protein [Planctomycetota bacterium]